MRSRLPSRLISEPGGRADTLCRPQNGRAAVDVRGCPHRKLHPPQINDRILWALIARVLNTDAHTPRAIIQGFAQWIEFLVGKSALAVRACIG